MTLDKEKEPDAEPDTDINDSGLVYEEPKALTATRPILYLAHQYRAGDSLPTNNPEMTAAWLESGSAAWRQSGGQRLP